MALVEGGGFLSWMDGYHWGSDFIDTNERLVLPVEFDSIAKDLKY